MLGLDLQGHVLDLQVDRLVLLVIGEERNTEDRRSKVSTPSGFG
jgi:hypothetical protein